MTGTTPALDIHRLPSGEVTERTVALLVAAIEAGAGPTDLAVLARVNSALLPVQVALTEAGIPHTAPLDASVLGRTGVRTALAYLRIGLDLDRIRRDDLFDTINRPARKVKSAVQPLLKGSRFSLPQLEQLSASLGETHRDRYEGYLADLRALERAITDGADTAACLAIVRNRIGLGEAMDALDSSRTRPEGSSHGDDLDALEQLATLHPDPGTFREWLVERLRVPGDASGITLSTVHRVKGMEWDHVVVFAANQGLFPHRLSDDLEEERRVFHVAITRCRSRVDVVADRGRISPFVDQLTDTRQRVPRPPEPQHVATPARVAGTQRVDGTVTAEPGLVVEVVGGMVGTVVDVGSTGVVVRVPDPRAGDDDPLSLRVPFGQPVTIEGRATALARPGRVAGTGVRDGRLALDGATEAPVDDALYEALRAWRGRIAAGSGVPAYLVFHDRHLQVIAGRKPRSVRELAACPGIGPTKLERYGDDVLDLVDQHRE
jgi:hypothetical protein